MQWTFKILSLVGVGWWVITGGCGQTEPLSHPKEDFLPPQAGAAGSPSAEQSGLSDKLVSPPGAAVLPGQPAQQVPPPSIPKVVMDEARRATFRVWVGQTMPDGPLANLQGEPAGLRSLLGQQVTVLVFWNSQSLSALEELQDLAKDLLPKYHPRGLRVVAVNVGEEASSAQKALPPAASGLPLLLDPNGQYFAQIAQQAPKSDIPLLPRTYLLDAEGKVLWLDIGYGESTLRGIETTVQAALGPQKLDR